VERPMRVLFVCSGNTCRSSMAEALARCWAEKAGVANRIRVASAGMEAFPGEPAAAAAVAVLKEEGIDLSGHRARLLTPEMVREADVILTMTRRHKEKILHQVPEAKGKVFVLKELAEGSDRAVADLESREAELLAAIRRKEEMLSARHREELESLRRERRELLERLEEVESRLQEWREYLERETQPEREELEELRQRMEEWDIEDPIGQPVAVYRRVREEIKENLPRIFARLLGEAESDQGR